MILAGTVSAPAGNWTIDGDSVYINDSKAYISASPHTIHESQWVYFNISAKNYSGNVDIAFGFDTDTVKPKTAELYKPQSVRLSDTFSEKIFYYVTNISATSLYPEYGNEYNIYRRQVKHKLPTGYNNSTNETIWGNFTTIVAFDSYTQSGQNYTINWSTRNYQNTTWKDISNKFDPVSWDYDGFNKWYNSSNMPIVAGNYYNLRVWMEVPVSLTPISGKYGFAIKSSSQTLEQAKNTGNLYYLDPWFNSSWGKRAPILINNTGNATNLTYYPVNLNVSYDSDMNENFSDLRIVNDTSGLEIPLNATINNSNYANLWFNATNIPASVWTNNTYYLYYKNPNAASVSNGANVFDFVDDIEDGNISDWSQQSGANGSASTVIAKTGLYSLKQTITTQWAEVYHTIPTASQGSDKIIEFWSNRYLSDNAMMLEQVGGVYANGFTFGIQSGTTTFAYYDTAWHSTGVTDSDYTWYFNRIKTHIGSSSSTIDWLVYNSNMNLISSVINMPSRGTVTNISAISLTEHTGTAYYDDFRVRKYIAIEPTAILGAEETVRYVPPTPIINTVNQGNFWINNAYTAGAGNITDSYNISVNGTWSNGTTALFTNTTLPAHGWKNVTIYAYNNSGMGTLSAAALTNNTQLSNNPPTAPTLTSDITLHEVNHTPAVNFTKGTDADGDTVTTYLYVDGSNPPTTQDISTTASSANIGAITTLTDGQTYYVRALSWDGYNWSTAYSAVDTFRMNSKPSVPALSSPINNQTVTTSTVNLSWAASTDSENDSITYDWQVNNTTQGTGVTGLTANKTLHEGTHNWSSRAYDGYEYSAWASVWNFIISSNNAAFKFTNKTLSETQIYQSSQATVIKVDVNDSDGTISGVNVTISYMTIPYILSMISQGGDTWAYSFRSSAPGTYTISSFNATDNSSGINSTTWSQTFTVVPVKPGGNDRVPPNTPTYTATPAVNGSLPLTIAPNQTFNPIDPRGMAQEKTGKNILYSGMIAGFFMIGLSTDKRKEHKDLGLIGLMVIAISLYGLGVIIP